MRLATSLERLDFQAPRNSRAPGLVSVAAAADQDRPDEGSVIREVATAFQGTVDYVFFRRFDDQRGSQPMALVIDNSRQKIGPEELARVHQRGWLTGIAPLIYVAWATHVDVLSCARGADFWVEGEERYQPAEKINVAGEIASELSKVRKFSALRLADGTFWDDPLNAKLASHQDSAQAALIQAIVDIDEELRGSATPHLRRLLLFTILIKYLDDRRVFPLGWFGKFHNGAATFFDVLASGDPDALARLLMELQQRFNGDVFASTEPMKNATPRQLRKLADLVEARTEGPQRLLWARYSFEHLPVEVISNIYQRFVRGPTAVYTPPFLASFLLDRVMPYETMSGTECVLDPACGSGVFLVGAFKRLVNTWRSRNDWRRPDVATLKGILRRSIFGVEVDPVAVELTAFSLCLALCDALRPDVIWSELRFDRLHGTNLITGDFFRTYEGQNVHTRYDVVVGNPPFESELSEAAEAHDKAAETRRGALPDKQVAYLFVERAVAHLNEGGRVCLIQPAGLLYGANAPSFRRYLFGTCTVEEVLDFVSIRNLYDGADPKTIALLARKGLPAHDAVVVHLTLRRTVSAKEGIGLELDHYDRHQVSYDRVDSDVWRANLLGGGRLSALANRFASMRTLSEFVEERGWAYGEGYIAAKGKQRASFLTGKPFLPTEALTTEGIDRDRVGTVEEKEFLRPRDPELYRAPLVVIREHESLPMDFVPTGTLAFKHKIVGIAAPPSERTTLKSVFDRLHRRRRQYQFFCALGGKQGLIGKATAILKNDIDRLPFPDDESELELAFWETILQDDVLDYMTDYVRLGQNAKVLMNEVTGKESRDYAQTFCELLGSVYANIEYSKPSVIGGVVCQPFYFGNAPRRALDGVDAGKLRAVVFGDDGDRLRSVRILRYYDENVMIIAKPDRLRYWLKSTAIWDADETLVDLVRQGY